MLLHSYFSIVACIFASIAAQSLPPITLFATGGTIAGAANSSDDTTGYTAGALTVAILINAVPSIANIANVTGVQISNVGSPDINETILLTLSKAINSVIANDSAQGVVITHGTDTLEETAMFLDLTYNASAPVVVVGAMRPATALSADGPYNLFKAVGLASAPSARNRGVMVTLNDRIGSAMYITKTNTRALDTFRAFEQGYLGVFLDEAPLFYYPPVRYTNKPYFDISNTTSLPNVQILYSYQDMDIRILNDVAQYAEGIVIAGSGDGSLSSEWSDAVANLTASGIPVVRSSRTGQSFVAPSSGALTSGNYNPPKARILLQLILNQYGGDNATLIQSFFDATSVV